MLNLVHINPTNSPCELCLCLNITGGGAKTPRGQPHTVKIKTFSLAPSSRIVIALERRRHENVRK